MTAATTVSDAAELARAISDGETEIEVDGVITGSPMITLAPGRHCAEAPCGSRPAASD